MSRLIPVTDATSYPLLALSAAQQLTQKVRARPVAGGQLRTATAHFAAAIEALKGEP